MERTKEILGTNGEDGEKKATEEEKILNGSFGRGWLRRESSDSIFTFSSLYGAASSARDWSRFFFIIAFFSYCIFAARYYRLTAA